MTTSNPELLKPFAEWRLEDAKARFSELVRRAQDEPQRVTVRGKDAVMIISTTEFSRLLPASAQPNLYELMQSSPLAGVDLELPEGSKAPVREVDL